MIHNEFHIELEFKIEYEEINKFGTNFRSKQTQGKFKL